MSLVGCVQKMREDVTVFMQFSSYKGGAIPSLVERNYQDGQSAAPAE